MVAYAYGSQCIATYRWVVVFLHHDYNHWNHALPPAFVSILLPSYSVSPPLGKTTATSGLALLDHFDFTFCFLRLVWSTLELDVYHDAINLCRRRFILVIFSCSLKNKNPKLPYANIFMLVKPMKMTIFFHSFLPTIQCERWKAHSSPFIMLIKI